jgi:hypothetical protein
MFHRLADASVDRMFSVSDPTGVVQFRDDGVHDTFGVKSTFGTIPEIVAIHRLELLNRLHEA